MNLLISKLLHWFVFSTTMFFAAGAVVDAGAAPAATEPAAAPAAEPAAPAAAEPSISDLVNESATEAAAELTPKPPAGEPAKPAEVKPAVAEPAKPAVDPAKPAEAAAKPAEAVVANPLDKLGPLPAEKITAALAAAPQEVKDYLAAQGLTVEALTESARGAAELGQFKEVFPSLDAANTALEGAQNFWKLDQGLPAVQNVQEFDKFMMETLVPMSYVRDEKGQPIPDPANPGAFKNDGSIAKLIDFSADVRANKMAELADLALTKATSDEEKAYWTDTKGALEHLGKLIANGYQMPGAKSTADKDLPQAVQDRLARADKIERESRERDSSTSRQQFEIKENKVFETTHAQLKPMIEQTMANATGLNAELKTSITKLVWQELTEVIKKNALYNRERDQLSPLTQDYEAKRVTTNLNYMKPVLAKLLAKYIGQVGGNVVNNNQQRHQKIDSQSNAGAMEPKTSGTNVQTFPAATSGDQFHAKAMEMARAENINATEGGPEYWRAVQKLDPL
jgi:hypothetical protein